jgi:hypothetical protein
LRRLALRGLLVTLAVVAVVSAAVAGAATAPQPEPAAAIPPAAMPDDPPVPPRRHIARGTVVMVREERLALKVESADRPIVVAIRPKTAVRLNAERVEFGDLQRGDQVVVVGKTDSNGNMVARAITAIRRPAPTPSA